MNLAQSIFIFLIINTKHGYSKPIKCSTTERVMETYENIVVKLRRKTKELTNTYERNYTLSNIKLPIFNQFLIINNSVVKEDILLQYNFILEYYHSALDTFGENHRTEKLKIMVKNGITLLNEIIKCFGAKKGTASRFNANEIKKKSEKVFGKRSSSIKIKIVYAILVQFVSFLLDFEKFLFNFGRYI